MSILCGGATRLISLFLVVVFVTLPITVGAEGQLSEGRYFVFTDRTLLKTLFGARHEFEGGFTADLTLGEAWTLHRLFKVSLATVAEYEVAQEDLGGSAAEVSVEQGEEGVGVRVALLDTGISRSHAALSGSIGVCADSTRSSFSRGLCDDWHGHGTHSAGLVHAVSPRATLDIYKTCDGSGRCFADDIAIVLEAALRDGANIILLNMSGDTESSLINTQLQRAHGRGVLIISPAGNRGPWEDSVGFPARDERVIAVGALDASARPAEFSSRGKVAVVASGVAISSTWPDGGYRVMSGTSVAASLVAGAAANSWNGNAEDTQRALFAQALDLDEPGFDSVTGHGQIFLNVVP